MININRKLKLSTLLTSLVACSVILTTATLLFVSYHFEKHSLIDAYLETNYSKSSKMSSSVDSLFKSMRMSLEETAVFFRDHDKLSDKHIQEHLELLRRNSRYFNSLSWIDEKGEIKNIAPISVGLKGQILTSGRTKEIVDSRLPTISEPYIGPTGRLIVYLTEPIYDNEKNYRGMIGGTIYLQEPNILNEILGNDSIDEHGSYYYVVGPNGKILFHPDKKLIGEKKSNPFIQKVMNGESGMGKGTNQAGVPMLAAYSIVPDIGWGVIQQTPVSFIYESLFQRIVRLCLYILFPLLVLLVFSIIIARKLAKPFFTLANLVNQLGSGKQVSIPEVRSHWNLEADLLTKSVMMAIEGIQEKNTKLTYEATTDSLTNIPNRRKLNEVMELWGNSSDICSIIAIDIDHFKSVNDTFGHQVGDNVLRFLVKSIQSKIRKADLCFRYGGEEFILFLPYTTAQDAYNLAEEIRVSIENTSSPTGKPITVSLGVSEYPFHSHSLEEVFHMADMGLYHSKSQGRNQVTIWNENLRTLKKPPN